MNINDCLDIIELHIESIIIHVSLFNTRDSKFLKSKYPFELSKY